MIYEIIFNLQINNSKLREYIININYKYFLEITPVLALPS